MDTQCETCGSYVCGHIRVTSVTDPAVITMLLKSRPRKKSDANAMVIRADARAMGAVTALNTTYRRKPRTYVSASECITYRNRDRSDATIFRSARAERRATSTRSASADAPKRTMAADLAPIGDMNH